jgi:oligoendopeptidase F
MYPSDEVWEQEYDKLLELAEGMKTFEGTLAGSGRILYNFFKKRDELYYYEGRVVVYANQRYHQDTAVNKYQGYAAKADHASAIASEAVAFARPEILEISDEELTRMMGETPELKEYERSLQEIRRFKEHTLSAPEERLLAKMGEVAAGPSNTFSMFNDADIHFPSVRDVEGNRIPITNGNFILLQGSRDRSLRKQVFEAYYHTYAQWGNTVAAMYANQVKMNHFFAEASKYSSPRAMFLDSGNIPESVYDNLIEAVHKYLPVMYRYVAARKKLLGVEQLHIYDVFAPVVDTVDHTYTFEEAKELVLAALEPMGEEYISILKTGFENRWIDVYENENKRSGAYSWGAYGTHPYVLLNFQGNLDSVFTLAHEMGHALHTYYSNSAQPFTYSGYLIFVAEVASTCNEALLMKYLLEHTEDPKEKLYLINHYLDGFRSTVFRQTMFAEFEQIVHTRQAKGESLTQETLNSIYHDLVKLYYGPDMVVDEEIDHEWMRIPHFYTSFYVYQYATGYSAATAFADKILKEGRPAVEAYIENFLKGGCAKDPIDILAAAGVDMSTPEPVEQALNVFESYLNLFEEQIEK